MNNIVKSSKGKILIIAVLVCVTIIVAYFLAVQAAEIMNTRRAKQRQEDYTQSILKNMTNLGIGQAIPDFTLEDLDNRKVKLSELLGLKTMISIFDPGCETCHNEMIRVCLAITNRDDYRHFIFISSGPIEQLKELKVRYNAPLMILYDKDNSFPIYFKAEAMPFNIIVNKLLKVEFVIAGIPSTEVLKGIIMADKPAQIDSN